MRALHIRRAIHRDDARLPHRVRRVCQARDWDRVVGQRAGDHPEPVIRGAQRVRHPPQLPDESPPRAVLHPG